MYLGHLNPPKAYFLWSEKLYLKKGFDDSFFLHNYMDFIIINSYNMTLQEKIAFIIVVYNTDLYKVLRKMQIRVLKREGY